MKTKHILIALAMVAALSMVSCKNNNKKTQSQEPTQEEVQEMKQALADSVLAEIDGLADMLIDAYECSFRFSNFELTEKEKMNKPDYLLDPSFATTLVSKSQKVNALAFYVGDLAVREIYDMPLEETKEAIAKLAVELNIPIDIKVSTDYEMPLSEKIKKEYNVCRESGDLAYFWQFEYALAYEAIFILSQNPEFFLSKITEEQWQSFCKIKRTRLAAVEELAKYDEEMAQLLELINKTRFTVSDEERDRKDQSIETAKQYFIANKDKYITKRNALLQ